MHRFVIVFAVLVIFLGCSKGNPASIDEGLCCEPKVGQVVETSDTTSDGQALPLAGMWVNVRYGGADGCLSYGSCDFNSYYLDTLRIELSPSQYPKPGVTYYQYTLTTHAVGSPGGFYESYNLPDMSKPARMEGRIGVYSDGSSGWLFDHVRQSIDNYEWEGYPYHLTNYGIAIQKGVRLYLIESYLWLRWGPARMIGSVGQSFSVDNGLRIDALNVPGVSGPLPSAERYTFFFYQRVL